MLNIHAILALWRRQLSSLLWNPLAYVFILAFVLVAAGFLFIDDTWFDRNIADLGPLLQIVPWELVVLLPALAMGTWASERELGTEEHLLTLPLSPVDALLGKWLGIVTFFSLALLCSASNVVFVQRLGQPDLGLICATFFGWWLAGLAFAAIGVFASTLVSLPAIAWVIGALLCAGTMLLGQTAEWFDPFNRGVISLGAVGQALLVTGLALGLATLVVSARRWSPAHSSAHAAVTVTCAALAVTLFNVALLIDRGAVDLDATSEGLSSLSATSLSILDELKEPVSLTAFISEPVPPELALKAKEVENVLKVLQRRLGSRLELSILRPADPLDEAGSLATQHFGLKTRKVEINTPSGRELAEVFLGVVARNGSRQQRIEYFDPGLSVEYEVVRALRTVGQTKKKVIGIVMTDLKLTGSFNYQTGDMRNDWELVDEWRKQYDVREVNLEAEVSPEIDILVAPQPSALKEEQLRRLHDYIWAGRPALLLEDPLPLTQDPELGTSRPKRSKQQNPYGPPEPGEPKADFKPFLQSLGLNMASEKVLWSDYNPVHTFRNHLERSIVWAKQKSDAVKPAAATQGISSLLFLWPGCFTESPGKNAELSVQPLVTPGPNVNWGFNRWDEHMKQVGFMPRAMKTVPERLQPEQGAVPFMAVEVAGRMKRAYPLPTKPEPKQDEATKDQAHKDEVKQADKKEEKKEEKPEPKKDEGLGQLSEKSVHVIVIADVDFASDISFRLYRQDQKMPEELQAELGSVQNIQFLANAVDALAGDEAFLTLRTRRPQRRALDVMEAVWTEADKNKLAIVNEAQKDAETKINKLNADFQAKIAKIQQNTELDDNTKEQLATQVQESAKRQLDADIDAVNLSKAQKAREADISRQRQIKAARSSVRWQAMGAPALILFCLAGGLYVRRWRSERRLVPTSRKRSAA